VKAFERIRLVLDAWIRDAARDLHQVRVKRGV
jgi:hypothetical protein